MDENKRQKLISILYEIPKSCGTCKFSGIEDRQEWGVCMKHTYKHLKHTGEERQLSIHRTGVCVTHETDEFEVAKLGLFKEFAS